MAWAISNIKRALFKSAISRAAEPLMKKIFQVLIVLGLKRKRCDGLF